MVQLRAPFSRRSLVRIASHKCQFSSSSIKLTLGKGQATGSKRDSGRFGEKCKHWCAGLGLGIFVTGLYYVLVNGPSRAAPTSATEPLSPWHFTPLTLTASTSCTPYTKLLTLTLPAQLIPDEAGRRREPIFSIYVKDSDIQVERPYTPLDGIDEQGQLRFWVKRYEGGEVGRWLHERKVGDVVEVRGPVGNWDWQDGEWDEIVMISGGTGITPFYQLLRMAFSGDGRPRTRFTLLHSSPRPVDLPPGEVLGPLQALADRFPKEFSLRLFVDSAELRQPSPELEVGRIGRKAIDEALKAKGSWWMWKTRPNVTERKVLFLICGPEGMVEAIAGPRGRNGSQGQVGGLLGAMGVEARQVWKL